jgi:plasmid stability protein
VKEKPRRRAARHGRSVEAEARLILAGAVAASDEPVDLVGSIAIIARLLWFIAPLWLRETSATSTIAVSTL